MLVKLTSAQVVKKPSDKIIDQMFRSLLKLFCCKLKFGTGWAD